MDVVVDPPDPIVEQMVTYTFPNHEFLPGDTVTCELVSQELPPETTTTVPETTTTVPETTRRCRRRPRCPRRRCRRPPRRRRTAARRPTVAPDDVAPTTPPTQPATADRGVAGCRRLRHVPESRLGRPERAGTARRRRSDHRLRAERRSPRGGDAARPIRPNSRSCCSRTSSMGPHSTQHRCSTGRGPRSRLLPEGRSRSCRARRPSAVPPSCRPTWLRPMAFSHGIDIAAVTDSLTRFRNPMRHRPLAMC